MTSSEPATIIAGITAAVAAVGTGVSIANKPPKPGDANRTTLNPAALGQQRSRAAAARGRSSTILTSQKLGNVG